MDGGAEVPHSAEVHARLAALEQGLAILRSEVVAEDRVTVLRIEALEAETRGLKAEIQAQESEMRTELAKKVDHQRYDIFERALMALIGVSLLAVLGAVLAGVIIDPSVVPAP